jgi:microcystin-dependent protein
MSDQYLGEIRAFGFNFAPVGWAQCNGQLLPIQQYTALFSLLGTNFGGNGTSNFGLPNLQGNVPMHWGQGTGLSQYFIGQTAGSATETLISNQMPMHNHLIQVAQGTQTNAPSPTTWLGPAQPAKIYVASGTPNVQLAQSAIGPGGGGQAHENRQPYETLNFCIAMQGVFPPRG